MHLRDISEICEKNFFSSQSYRVMSVSSIFLMSNLGGGFDLLFQRADTDWQTQRRQTERQTHRGTCRYANAAIRRHSDTSRPAQLSALRGQPGYFSHFHRQPSFSTLLESGHCHLLLSFWAAEPISVWEIECSAFCYEQDYSDLWWASESHLRMGC